MEDFFKDRPVVPSAKDTVFLGGTPGGGSVSPASLGAFAPIHRDAGASAGAAPAPAAKPAASVRGAEKQDLKSDHGTRVQTIVERGRVTRIVVTCSCGKVTEIDCQY